MSTARQYIRHAQLYGNECVIETAAADADLSRDDLQVLLTALYGGEKRPDTLDNRGYNGLIETSGHTGQGFNETPQLSHRAWRRSDVHKHSDYFCLQCGSEFKTPQAVYKHLDTRHR